MIGKFAGLLLSIGLVVRFMLGSGTTDTTVVDPAVLEDTANGQVGRFIVVLRSQRNLTPLAVAGADRLTRRRQAVDALRQEAATSQGAVTAQLDALGARYQTYWLINAIAVVGGRDAAEAMANRPDVLRIEPDRPARELSPQALTRTPTGAPPTTAGVAWNIQQIRAPEVWALGDTGQGLVFGEPDTGVKWDHPALQPQYRGWNGTTADHNYNWWDAVHEQLSKNGPSTCGYSSPVPCDDVGHGTAITGTAVGDDHANNHIGVAPGATWIGCRDQDQGIGQPSMEIECYQFLTAPTDLTGGNPDPTRGADVINTSFTCKPSLPSCDPASLQLAIANLQTAGIFVTAAAGNEGPGCGTIQDPISWYPSVVAVGGTTDTSDDLASYSSRGPVTQDGSNRLAPLLVAPSQTISTTLGNGYQDWTGTSFSSPEVGGVVLLLWAAYPNLRGNLATTLTVLEESALKLAPPPDQLCGGDAINQVPNNATGYGRVDALSAYQVIVATPSPSDPRAYLPLVPGGSAVGW